MNQQSTPQTNLCPRCGSERTLGGKTLKEGECNVCLVAADMWEAAGNVLVKRFPEFKSGDVSPLVTLAVADAHEGLAKEWITCNAPRPDHE